MEALRKNRKAIALLGCVLIILGCFLPFVSAMGIGIDYATGDGKLVMIAVVVTGILIILIGLIAIIAYPFLIEEN